MPRQPRLFVAGIPYHVTQRGNNRAPIFFSDSDYSFFLDVLQEAKAKHPCLVYAYCLMPNHFHLLLQPRDEHNVSLLIKLIGAKYVRYINKTNNRSGTLWQGRFKCSLIEQELHFINCLRYIEMNPVRSGIVKFPEQYRWSSYRFRAMGEKNPVLDFDPWYISLSDNPSDRQARYRHYFADTLPDSTLKLFREMTNRNGIVGGANFKVQIEHSVHREIIVRPAGRPRIEK